MKRAPPSTIPLQNYGTQNMSPLTKLKNAPNYFDNQSYSLFGDPIPPPIQQDEYLENLDNLYGRFRHNSDSSIIDDFPKPDIFVQIKNEKPRHGMRLFSENPKDNIDLYTVSGNPSLLTPQVVGPDIRILPDSDSSSDATRSPRNLITHRDDNLSQQNVLSINRNEAEKRKLSSDYSDDFKSNYEKFRKSDKVTSIPKRIFSNEPTINYSRKNSNESYSSNDWFKPSHDYEEFTKIPKLRPSSKNVMSINQHDTILDSPVATLLNDFVEYSSEGAADEILQPLQPQKLLFDGERFSKKREIELDFPINHQNLSIQGLPPTGLSNMKRETSPVIVKNVVAIGADYRISPPRSRKKPSFIIIAENSVPLSRPQSASQLPNNSQQQHSHQQHIKEIVHTGAGRVSPFLGRGFKENIKLQPSHIPEHPLPAAHLKLPVISGRTTNNRNNSDESPRPSVQFNMSIGSRDIDNLLNTSTRNLQSKHLRRPVSAVQPSINQKIRSFETLPNINGSSGSSITIRTPARKLSTSSTDLFQESRSASAIAIRSRHANKNPTSREKGVLRVINSATSSPSRIPVTNLILDNLDKSSSKRSTNSPLRDFRRRSTSPERRSSSQTQPRSSISSFRRSSNLSSVTTSDFSYRRNSISPMRRTSISPAADTNNKDSFILPVKKGKTKSSLQTESQLPKKPHGESINNYYLGANKSSNYSTRKVAKPTTLSPIIGTPNKDGPITPEEMEIASKFTGSGGSAGMTKIPIRNGSNVTSRSESRVQSRAESRAESRSNSQAPTAANSRSNSPQKDFAPYSRPNSRAESKSSTRVSSRSNSRAESLFRPIARVTSNFNSKSPSPADSKRPSRAKSRTNSHLNQKKSVESNSKIRNKSDNSKSRKSPPKDRKKSSSNSHSSSPNKSRRKSGSPKKQSDNKSRGRSTSSKTINSNSKIPSPKKAQNVNRSYLNRTSTNKESTSAKTNTSAKSQALSSKSTSSSVKKGKDLKRENTNLYRSSSNLKKDITKKEQSPIKRSVSNIKREQSRISLKGDSSNLKRENSNLKQSEANSGNTLQKEQSTLKMNTDKIRRVPSLLRLRTDSNLNKKLERKGSSKNLETKIKSDNTTTDELKTQEEITASTNVESNGTLIPLTKANVVSMTTAAITAQPVHITTALTNQLHVTNTNNNGQLASDSVDAKTEDMSIPVAILEKSQKTLENIQKTVTEATDEIQKTINDNLTDLKTLETDMGKITTDVPAPLLKTDSKKSLKDKMLINNLTDEKNKSSTDESSGPPSQPIEASVSVVQGNNHLDPNAATKKENQPGGISEGQNLAEDMAERVSERAISVLPYVDSEDANLQNYEHQLDSENYGEDTVTIGRSGSPNNPDELVNDPMIEHIDGNNGGDNNNLGSDSQEYLDEEQATGCCGRSRCSKCCSRFCMPCRRCQGSKCCKKKTITEDIETTSVIVKEVDEKPATKKPSCWKRMSCCKKKNSESIEENIEQKHMETINEEPEIANSAMSTTPKQSKCGMCLSKIFCCRATNKVEASTVDMEPVKKCCFCIPCKRKKTTSPIETAWQAPPDVAAAAQRRESILSAPAVPLESRCTRIMNKLKFWKKKDPSRRASMGSRKQSLAPTNPPEDTRPKLHNDLVDYNSKMKAAIPVLPIYLAYFCTGCNIIIPGLGTILSGIFCICVGIPRFSQYDSAKARLGSFVINCFVGIAQLFCVLFCFVGWGWSIWWGSIMMKTARKLQKIRKVEKLELEEEQRQAVLTAQAAAEKKATETAGTKA